MEKTIKIKGKSTNYYEIGSIKERPIIILHGLRGDHKALINFGKLFGGFRVIIPDLPGHGRSDEISVHTMDSYSQWLLGLIDSLKLKNVIVIGHSLGANIGMMAVKKDKGRRITQLIAFLLYPKYHDSGINRAVKSLYQIGKKIPHRISKKLLQSRPISYITIRPMVSSNKKDKIKYLIQENHRTSKQVSPRVVIDILEDLGTENMIDHVEPSVAQIFVITSEDKFSHNEEIKKISIKSGGELIEITDLGHLAPLEDPERLVAEIIDFI
jgi:pimeloyl-ACP methyl ester carboxylesterase